MKIEREGIGFAPVLFGAHRKSVGAIVSVALLDQLESLLEDVVIAPRSTSGSSVVRVRRRWRRSRMVSVSTLLISSEVRSAA